METVCINAEGNRATIGGVITEVRDDAGYPDYFKVGNYVYLAVEDNGEGAMAPPDKTGSALYIGFADDPLFCDVLPPTSDAWLVYGPWLEVYLPSDQIQVNN